MALHDLKIIVVDGGNSIISTKTNKKVEGQENNDPKESKLFQTLNLSNTIKNKIQKNVTPYQFYALQAGASVAIQTLKQTANYFLSDIGRSNGDSNYQAQVNKTLEVVGDITSVTSSMFSGAAAGASFGPIGALTGLIIGGISSGINLAFKYAEKQREFQHEMFKDNTSQSYNLARANYSVLTGRLR